MSLTEFDDLLWLMAQESAGKVGAPNGQGSSARGLFQLLKMQYQMNPNGEKSFGNALEECQGGIRYIIGRYHSAAAANRFLLKHHWYRAMRRCVVFSLLVLGLSLSALTNAETLAPKFEDYGVKDKSSKRVSKVRIVSTQDKTHRTMLRAVIGQKPNFAGHFVMVEIGCGASCVRAAAIDTKSEAIFWLPFTVCCFPSEVEEPIRYTLDSSLIEVRGMRDEKSAGTSYYQFIRGRFDLVKEIEGP